MSDEGSRHRYGTMKDRRRLKKRDAERLEDLLGWFDGRDGPAPHLYKRRVIRQHARQYGLRTLIETGTYLGEMIDAQLDAFERIVSIELSEELAARARARYAGIDRVEIVQGDSGECLAQVVARLDEPALFWLDGHWSGGITARGHEDTPLRAELEAIMGSGTEGHVVLVDDARCFGQDENYPDVSEIHALVRQGLPGCGFVVAEDIMRITPPGSSAVPGAVPGAAGGAVQGASRG